MGAGYRFPARGGFAFLDQLDQFFEGVLVLAAETDFLDIQVVDLFVVGDVGLGLDESGGLGGFEVRKLSANSMRARA